MSYDTQETPASAARQTVHHVDLIANTSKCGHAPWLGQIALFAQAGEAIQPIRLADGDAAIATVDILSAQVRR
ncbi:hypothetical protein FHR49_002755 [Xanthomonas campestris]